MKQIVKLAQLVSVSKIFRGVIFALILLTAVITGIETYPDLAARYHHVLVFLDKLIVYSFTLEIIIKMLALDRRPLDFFRDPWNVFDFVIVAVCLLPFADTHFVAVLRVVRVLRILRMITFFPKLRLLIGALLKSIPSMGYVIVLLFVLFYVYAVMGVFLFGKADPLHFGDLHHAMVTLFKVLTLEGWTDIMNVHLYETSAGSQGRIASIGPFFYFASFILIGAMIIMNLFIGVIMRSMEESQDEMSAEIRKLNSKVNPGEYYTHIIDRLDELKKEILDMKNGSGNP
ncbi:MAG TPA: ion transporter [Bacteroidales bacterium]|nr:ion transporter [Bacteroidales bacterium]